MRFILLRQSSNNDCVHETYITTLDTEELERFLRSGGSSSNGDWLQYRLMGVELIDE